MESTRSMILQHIATIDRNSGGWTGSVMAQLLQAKSDALRALAALDSKESQENMYFI